MIVWLNGAFGAGKTSTAERLVRRLPGAHLYDPEQAGFFLRDSLPPALRPEDFQDLPLWRTVNRELLRYLDERCEGPVVVPMTIRRRAYYEEILGRLRESGVDVRHFILTARRETILQRQARRGDGPDNWPARQLDACLAAFDEIFPGEAVDTEGRTAEETAAAVLARLERNGGRL